MAIDFQPASSASGLDFKPAQPAAASPTLDFKPAGDSSIDFAPTEKPVGQRSFMENMSALPHEYAETSAANYQGLKNSLWQNVPGDDLLSRGLAALDVLGSTARFAFSPVEALGRWTIGDPYEAITKQPGSSKQIGEGISFIAQAATDPITMGSKAGEAAQTSEVGKATESALSPTTITPEAGQAGSLIRARSGQLAMDTARASHDLEEFRAGINKLPEQQRFEFMDTIEQGGKQAKPELQPVADKMRQMLDDAKSKVQGLGNGYLDKAIDNYFPHIWKDPTRAATVQGQLEEEMARTQSRRPIQGSPKFLKQRTIDTIAQGRARGLELMTTDPIELTLIKIREMNKFYYGTLMADDMKQSGLASFVRSTDRPPPGWVKLDDKVFTARVPAAKLAAKAGENAAGVTHFGDWYAPAEVARVFNNYVSPGLSGRNALFDTVRHAGNSLNLLQLGVSGFHATMTSLDTIVSNGARVLENLSRGEFGEAGKNLIGVSPLGAVTTARAGGKLRKAAMESAKQTLTPEMQKLVESLEQGGGRLSMDNFYRAVDSNGLIRGLRNGSFINGIRDNFKANPYSTVLKTPFDIAGRAIQDISAPLMDELVPRYKLGVFSNMMSDFIRRNPNASQEELRLASQKAWDSVDNRLGQMVYDNVFWNKTGKDLAFIAVRSVGWNLGTIRELGGSVFDSARAISALRKGEKAEFTHRMAYAVTLPVVIGFYGAVLTYLYTGHGPETITDYFYPLTGGTTPEGYPERISIPSYIKDVVQYNRAPVQTGLNKLNPIWAVLAQLHANQDFYGGLIQNPDDPLIVQYQETGEYLAQQFEPFSFRGAQRLSSEGATLPEEVGSFFGFQPAPGFIVNPEKQESWERRQNQKALKRKQKEDQ